jgi:hypothetical protein
VIWALAVAVANATRAMVACMVARRFKLIDCMRHKKPKKRTHSKSKKLKKVEKQLHKTSIECALSFSLLLS